jgi:hypothetical protein
MVEVYNRPLHDYVEIAAPVEVVNIPPEFASGQVTIRYAADVPPTNADLAAIVTQLAKEELKANQRLSAEAAYQRAFNRVHRNLPAQYATNNPAKKGKNMHPTRDGLAAYQVIVANASKFSSATVQYAREQLAEPQQRSTSGKPSARDRAEFDNPTVLPSAGDKPAGGEEDEMGKHHRVMKNLKAQFPEMYSALRTYHSDFNSQCRAIKKQLKDNQPKNEPDPADEQNRDEADGMMYAMIQEEIWFDDPVKERDNLAAMSPAQRLDRCIEIRERYQRPDDDAAPSPAVVDGMVRYAAAQGWDLENPVYYRMAQTAVSQQRHRDKAVRDAVDSQVDARTMENVVKYCEQKGWDYENDEHYRQAMSAVAMQQRRR